MFHEPGNLGSHRTWFRDTRERSSEQHSSLGYCSGLKLEDQGKITREKEKNDENRKKFVKIVKKQQESNASALDDVRLSSRFCSLSRSGQTPVKCSGVIGKIPHLKRTGLRGDVSFTGMWTLRWRFRARHIQFYRHKTGEGVHEGVGSTAEGRENGPRVTAHFIPYHISDKREWFANGEPACESGRTVPASNSGLKPIPPDNWAGSEIISIIAKFKRG